MEDGNIDVPLISALPNALPIVQVKDDLGGGARAHLLAELWEQYHATGRLHPIASRSGLASPHASDAQGRVRVWLARYPAVDGRVTRNVARTAAREVPNSEMSS